MSRSVLIAALLVCLGLVAASLLFSARSSSNPVEEESRVALALPTPGRHGFGIKPAHRKTRAPRADFGRRVPAAPRAGDIPQRRNAPSQHASRAASEDIAAPRHDSDQIGSQATSPQPTPPNNEPGATGAHPGNTGVVLDYSQSALERALTEAGLPPAAAADIKRRYDELAMDETSLRNTATREGWINTPRFNQELDDIEADRLAIRDEIGDEAYDNFLFATGQPNRVYVTDVMQNSPAAQAGLQTSDVIVSYDGARILTPDDLVAETEVGTVGETIKVKITRNGQPLEVEIPRGPLGLRIGVTQEPPANLGGHSG